MFIAKKFIIAPVAAALVAATLIGTAQAGPRQQQGPEARGSAITLEVDYRKGQHKGRGHGPKWGHGEKRGHWGKMGPRQVRRSLKHRGFHKIRILGERGPVYMVRAHGWRGMPMRLVVDGHTGQILRKRPIHRHGHWNYRW
ncbi:hypothetical protein [uncultured Roseibium sp.]|uniref:hypothetical protein n=1 Tax=uncultured Roseibium sp. TaxID=1936171 RepID=UPI002597E686|nr:hypothetical protein [uncultured Roseibium sp.]